MVCLVVGAWKAFRSAVSAMMKSCGEWSLSNFKPINLNSCRLLHFLGGLFTSTCTPPQTKKHLKRCLSNSSRFATCFFQTAPNRRGQTCQQLRDVHVGRRPEIRKRLKCHVLSPSSAQNFQLLFGQNLEIVGFELKIQC